MWDKLKPGDPVYITGEKRPYRVKCRDDRFIICTKPMNLYHTVKYFIIDLKKQRRGPDNMVFCSGYETQEQCEERLKELQSGEIEVSHRHGVSLGALDVNTATEYSAEDVGGLWCDDITFCPYKGCRRRTCPRNQMHIRDHSVPHSFFVERPPDCPYCKKQDNFYHIREKVET